MGPKTLCILVLLGALFSPFIAKGKIRVDYYFVRIETPGFEVDSSGYSELMTRTFQGIDHVEFPLTYELNRNQYSIFISLVLDSNQPKLLIVARDSEDRDLTLGGEIEDKCYGYFHDMLYRETPIDEAVTTLRFTWASRSSEECYAQDKPIDVESKMLLRVYSVHGDVLGEEPVAYTVQENGHYYVKDGP